MRRRRTCCGSCRLGQRRGCRFITTRRRSRISACTRRGRISSTSCRIMRDCTGRLRRRGLGYSVARVRQDDYLKETAVLSAEAMADAGILDEALKYALDREYPMADNARGGFWPGGPKSWPNNPSMPSEHAMNVWAFAHVVAGQYDGIATKSRGVWRGDDGVGVARAGAAAFSLGRGGGEHVWVADRRVRAASSVAGAWDAGGCVDGGDAVGDGSAGGDSARAVVSRQRCFADGSLVEEAGPLRCADLAALDSARGRDDKLSSSGGGLVRLGAARSGFGIRRTY